MNRAQIKERATEMVRTYESWQESEKDLHPLDCSRRGYSALASVFGVSYHAARNAIVTWRGRV